MGDCDHKYGSFTIKRALGSVGTDAFEDELQDEIQENDSNLELDFYCQNGGYIDEVTVEDISIDEPDENGIVSGQFSVSFAFPLTLALSLGERGNPAPSYELSHGWIRAERSQADRCVQSLFPLPEGEGQGEGKVSAYFSEAHFDFEAQTLSGLAGRVPSTSARLRREKPGAPESQRDSGSKPKVARHALPWVDGVRNVFNPNGVEAIRHERSPQPRWDCPA
jgi:hypothetical protein